MRDQLLKRMFKITERDDQLLKKLAEKSGTRSKSAEVRMLIRRAAEVHGLVDQPAEGQSDGAA